LKRALGPIALMALSACATAPDVGGGLRSITYETGGCFGACPVFRLEVNADGAGLFEGRRFTAATGERRFTVTPAQFGAFAARLAPDRLAEGERRYVGESCRQMATDQDSVQIAWSGAAEQRLYVYYGCDMARNRAMYDRLRAAPRVLPIGDFIGPSR
jgi:hypothetical protein